jgi:hypothetical protein
MSNTDPNKSLFIGRPAMLRYDPESNPDCNIDHDQSPYAWTAPLEQTYTDNGCIQSRGGLARTSIIVGSLFLVNIDIDHCKKSLISLRSRLRRGWTIGRTLTIGLGLSPSISFSFHPR